MAFEGVLECAWLLYELQHALAMFKLPEGSPEWTFLPLLALYILSKSLTHHKHASWAQKGHNTDHRIADMQPLVSNVPMMTCTGELLDLLAFAIPQDPTRLIFQSLHLISICQTSVDGSKSYVMTRFTLQVTTKLKHRKTQISPYLPLCKPAGRYRNSFKPTRSQRLRMLLSELLSCSFSYDTWGVGMYI